MTSSNLPINLSKISLPSTSLQSSHTWPSPKSQTSSTVNSDCFPFVFRTLSVHTMTSKTEPRLLHACDNLLSISSTRTYAKKSCLDPLLFVTPRSTADLLAIRQSSPNTVTTQVMTPHVVLHIKHSFKFLQRNQHARRTGHLTYPASIPAPPRPVYSLPEHQIPHLILTPILYSDPNKQVKAASGVASFLANEFPLIVSVHPNDKYCFCTPIINIGIDNHVSSTLAKQSSIPGLEFFAMVVVVHGLAHAASNVYHLGIPELTRCFVGREANTGYRLETAFFGSIMGIVFQTGTAQDPQLPIIAYFMIRSSAGKVYKIDMSIQEFLSVYRYLRCFCADIEAVTWITATEGRIAPFDFDALEEMKMDGQDFLTHTCAFVNAAYAPVNIQPRLSSRTVQTG